VGYTEWSGRTWRKRNERERNQRLEMGINDFGENGANQPSDGGQTDAFGFSTGENDNFYQQNAAYNHGQTGEDDF
jgi:hypothetical protein